MSKTDVAAEQQQEPGHARAELGHARAELGHARAHLRSRVRGRTLKPRSKKDDCELRRRVQSPTQSDN
eukprot:5711702-Heterocapsa_arctica.AAC.1